MQRQPYLLRFVGTATELFGVLLPEGELADELSEMVHGAPLLAYVQGPVSNEALALQLATLTSQEGL